MNIDFEKYFSKGEKVAVALSGGEDSMCLLYLLKDIADISLSVVNVEHGIRGETSKSDSAFCEEVADKLSLPFYAYTVDAPLYAKDNGYTLEQAARILRYDCFFKLIDSGKADKIAVAHHKDDNVETLLFNLFRGSSLSGAVGISTKAYEGKIVRPLLEVEKREIQAFIAKKKIPFVTDESNFDVEFSRNALRREIIPAIEKRFPHYKNSLLRFARLAEEDDEFLNNLAKKLLFERNNAYFIAFCEDFPVFSRAVKFALKALGVVKDYEYSHIKSVFDLQNRESGRSVDLPKNLIAVKDYDGIIIQKKAAECEYAFLEVPFAIGSFDFPFARITVEKVDFFNFGEKNCHYIDGDKLPSSAVFRTRKTSDEFTKFGGGTKSLGDYLTDTKVPKRERDGMILIADKNIVYYLGGKEISERVKIDKSTTNMIKLTYEIKEKCL